MASLARPLWAAGPLRHTSAAPTRLTCIPARLRPIRAQADDTNDEASDEDAAPLSSRPAGRPPGGRKPRLEPKQSTRLRSQLRAMLPDPVDDPLFDAAALQTTDDEEDGGGEAGAQSPDASADAAPRRRATGAAAGSARAARAAPPPPPSPARSARPPPAATSAAPPPPAQAWDEEAVAHALTGGYHRLHEVDLAQEAAMQLLTEQRGRGVNVYGQTVAMASLMAALDQRARPPGEEFVPDWIVATFGLERCWEGLAAREADRAARIPLQEAWAPSPALQDRVASSDPALYAGAPATTPAESDWGADAERAYDDLLAGVLPGVVEGGGGGQLPG